jgi:hypothetical protein
MDFAIIWSSDSRSPISESSALIRLYSKLLRELSESGGSAFSLHFRIAVLVNYIYPFVRIITNHGYIVLITTSINFFSEAKKLGISNNCKVVPERIANRMLVINN